MKAPCTTWALFPPPLGTAFFGSGGQVRSRKKKKRTEKAANWASFFVGTAEKDQIAHLKLPLPLSV